MANHRAAAALLMIVSLLVAVARSGANARTTVRPNKAAAAAALLGSNTRLTVRHDDAHGPGYMDDVAAPAVPDSELTDSKCPDKDKKDHPKKDDPKDNKPKKDDPKDLHPEAPAPQPDPTELETESEEPGTELCSTCEKPKPELTCNKVHAVREGETCFSVGQCAGLGQDDFLRFNPNICCDNLFVGQWVCLEATCA